MDIYNSIEKLPQQEQVQDDLNVLFGTCDLKQLNESDLKLYLKTIRPKLEEVRINKK